jgi:hypothetical protein
MNAPSPLNYLLGVVIMLAGVVLPLSVLIYRNRKMFQNTIKSSLS